MKKLRTVGRAFVLGLVVSVLLAFGLSSSARADSETITLSVANPNLATQGAGPYASVVISLTGSTVTVTATRDDNFVFGDSSVLGLNLSSAAGTVSGFSSISPTTLTLVTSPPSTSNVDGFGSFNFVVNDGPGFSSPLTSLSFSFNISGTLSGVASLLALNSDNADVVAHMALATNTACTGFAANTGATKPTGSPDNSACVSGVPEPSSAALLFVGAMLIGGTYLLRRRETDDMAI